MSRLLLRACSLLVTEDDRGSEPAGTSLVVENSWITYIGTETPDSGQYDETIDCSQFVAFPGLVNTHHHLYQTLTRAFPQSTGLGLFDWLRLLYPIWAGLDEEMIRVSTRAGLAELLLSGCTTCADHLYVFPRGSEHFMDASIAAAQDVGIRFHPTRGSMDLGQCAGGLPPDAVIQSIDAILTDSERVIGAYHDPHPGSMLRIGLAPCSPFSVTRELMTASAELARRLKVRLHTHIAETRDEDAYSRERYGCTPVELLNDLGWLGSDVWLAHCVHPHPGDMDLLSATHAGIAHCPTSNMLLGSGLAPVREFIQRGIPVGLGVDGSASNDANDLRAEVKQAVLSARVRDGVESMTARQALRIATRGGADCLGREDIGSLDVGKVADIVLFDRDDLALSGGQDDVVAAIVLGAIKPHTVIVNGRVRVHEGQLVDLDERELAGDQNAASSRLLGGHR